MTVTIYALTDIGKHQIRYVGKTKNLRRRLEEHIEEARLRRTHKERWLAKKVESGEGFGFLILKTVPSDEADTCERCFIKAFREERFPILNATDGGDGLHPTPETRAKMSASHRGKPNPMRGKSYPSHVRETVSQGVKRWWANLPSDRKADIVARRNEATRETWRRKKR